MIRQSHTVWIYKPHKHTHTHTIVAFFAHAFIYFLPRQKEYVKSITKQSRMSVNHDHDTFDVKKYILIFNNDTSECYAPPVASKLEGPGFDLSRGC